MVRSAAWALGALLVLGACSGDDAPSVSSSTSTTSTTFDRKAEEQAVIAAYLAGLDAFYAASNPPNPDHPALAETATGPLLETVRANLTDLAARGIGIRRGADTANNPKVRRLTSRAALLDDCSTDGDIQFDLASGEVLNEVVSYGRLTARMVKSGSRWLVESRTTERLETPCE